MFVRTERFQKNFLDEALDYFADDQALINQSEIEDEANWKILHETLLEGII